MRRSVAIRQECDPGSSPAAQRKVILPSGEHDAGYQAGRKSESCRCLPERRGCLRRLTSFDLVHYILRSPKLAYKRFWAAVGYRLVSERVQLRASHR